MNDLPAAPAPAPRIGLATFFAVAALVAGITVLFVLIRPPTVEEVERDIWSDWARLATDAQGRTIVDQLLDDHQAAGQRLLESLGRLIESGGDGFVVPTRVRYLRIRDRSGDVFAQWIGESGSPTSGWKELSLPLIDPKENRAVGALEVSFQFYGAGLESLPHIRRLERTYAAAFWLVVLLAAVILLAVFVNIARLRERAGRLESQRIALELARQMCHELRNGLWAFSLEGKNVEQLFAAIDDFAEHAPEALRQACRRCGLSDEETRRLERAYGRQLADRRLEPGVDLASANQLARQAHVQIESFSRYISLTVEELDRNLLGAAGQWTPAPLRVYDAWEEACRLLELRLRGAGVEIHADRPVSDDWVLADHRALVHVFVNLLKNAVEEMRTLPPPRRIDLRIERQGSEILCSVANAGREIPARELEHLFKPGWSTKPGPGRGTGLVLVQQALARMGARIQAEGRAGGGAVFRLRFPAQVPAASDAAALPPAQS